jgi:hypothetical protein
MRIRVSAATLALALIVAGCAHGPFFWSRAGSVSSDFQADHAECFKAATIGYGIGAEKTYKACLTSKGWTRSRTADGLPDDKHFRGVEGDDEFARSLTPEEHREQLLKEQQQGAADELACSRPPASPLLASLPMTVYSRHLTFVV